MLIRVRSILLISGLLLVAPLLWAQDNESESNDGAAEAEVSEGDAEGDGTPVSQAIYLPIKPAFVVNYGAAGRLRYLKAEVSVRVANIEAANSVRYHLPLVRNNLVMLFASQTNATVSSQDGKEAIRADALEEIRDVVEREDQVPRSDIVDVFFNNFIVQK